MTPSTRKRSEGKSCGNPTDQDQADFYDKNAKQEAVVFDDQTQREILALAHEICQQEGWKLELAGFDETHTHLVLSWTGYFRWEEVDRRLKNLLVLRLNRRHNTPGKRWFVRRHSAPRRVEDRKHFNRLRDVYLPDHRGLFWSRGMPVPHVC